MALSRPYVRVFLRLLGSLDLVGILVGDRLARDPSPEVTPVRSLLYNPAFAALDERDRLALQRAATFKRVAAGEALVLAGEPQDSIYLVTDGVFKLVTYMNAHERPVDIVVPGDLIGDVEALLETPARWDVVACLPAVVMVFGRAGFLETMSASSATAMARTLAQKLDRTRQQNAGRSFQRVDVRVASKLMELAEQLGHRCGDHIELDLPLNQTEFGQLAGTTREATCRTLKGLERQGVLQAEGRRLRIMKPDLLERIRCGERVAAPCRSADAATVPRSRSNEDT